MKKLHDRMRNRLRILATIILAALGVACIATGFAGTLFVGAVVALVVPANIKDEDKMLFTVFMEEARKEAQGLLQKQLDSTMTADQLAQKMDEKMTELMKKYGIDNFQDQFKGKVDKKELDDLVDKVKEQGILIAQIKNAGGTEADKGWRAQLRKELNDKADQIKAAVEKKETFKLSLKDASAIMTTSNIGAGVVIGFRETGINEAPRRPIFIRQLIQNMFGGPGSNPLSWLEKKPKGTGTATPVAESAAKPLIDFEYALASVNSEVIAALVYVTKQAVTNMTILANEIETELMKELAEKVDYQLIYGDGVSPNLKGIKGYATAFSAGTLAGTIVDANYFDVLRAAILQVRNSRFVPNYIVVSHDAAAMMDLAKASDGHYVMPPFTTPEGTVIKGIPIIEQELEDADEFFVMDTTRSLVNFVEDVQIEIGWINDQFAKNQYTIRGEVNCAHRIKYHDKPAFVVGKFTEAIAALELIEG